MLGWRIHSFSYKFFAQWVVTTTLATGQNMTPSTEQVRKTSVCQLPLCPVLEGTLYTVAVITSLNAIAVEK